MPPRYLVRGGHTLRGTVRPAGNKNAALPASPPPCWPTGPVELDNMPRIRDVETMLAILADLGAGVEWIDTNPSGSTRGRHREQAARSRGSAPGSAPRSCSPGPLLARFGRVTLPPPGGDVIGRRRVDTHFLALEALGAEVQRRRQLRARRQVAPRRRHLPRRAERHRHRERADGGGAGARAAPSSGTPPPSRTCRTSPGSWWRWAPGSRGSAPTPTSSRAASRSTAPRYTIGPDHIEIGTFIGLAAVTNSALTIDGVRGDDLRGTLLGFERLGIRPRLDGQKLIIDADQERRIRPDLGGHVPKLEDGPWPAFPADTMSIALVAATQCEGHAARLREDVRVADVLRGQADRDGRADRALRPAPRGRWRGPSSCGAGRWNRPTSGPAWRC